MYGQLGDIQFDLLLGPSDEDRSFGHVFARHPKINGRDKLQSTGIELKEIDMAIKFHASFCNPQENIDKLEKYANNATILKYVTGSGLVLGNYVIERGRNKIKKTFDDGALRSCEIRISLLEYYIADKKGNASTQARLKAFALNKLQPLPTNLVPNIDDNITLLGSKDVAEMNASVSVISQMNLKVRNIADFAEQASGKVTEAVNKGNAAVNKLQNRISEVQALADLVQQLPARLADLQANYNNIASLMPITDPAAFYQATINVKNSMSFVNYAASPMSAFAGFRGTFPQQ